MTERETEPARTSLISDPIPPKAKKDKAARLAKIEEAQELMNFFETMISGYEQYAEIGATLGSEYRRNILVDKLIMLTIVLENGAVLSIEKEIGKVDKPPADLKARKVNLVERIRSNCSQIRGNIVGMVKEMEHTKKEA